MKKILMGNLFELNGLRIRVVSRTENRVNYEHVNELAIDDDRSAYLKALDKYVARCMVAKKELEVTKYDVISREQNLKLYDWFIERLKSNAYNQMFTKVIINLEKGRDTYVTLSIQHQSETLLEILKLFQCDGRTSNLQYLSAGTSAGSLKRSSVISTCDSAYLINQSVTGLYEVKVDLLKG